ncbi:MAG: RNA methyltransferase, partial [Christensenellaceae bacterium]|nr:RNA methyltransferase [Christensenellaceae bacterium]
GAAAIVLFPSERVIAKPSGDGKKLARLATIALDAAKQSGRGIVPAVTAEDTFESAIRAAARAELPIFFYENERENALYDVLTARGKVKTVSIVTGAEGGFTPGEAAFAAECGLVTASLGTRILRCDTAPIAATAVITAVITAINN